MAIGQTLGGALDYLGTAFNLPEIGLSEKLSGGATQYTGTNPLNRAQTQFLASNPGTAYVNPTTGSSTQYNPSPTSQMSSPTSGNILGLSSIAGSSGGSSGSTSLPQTNTGEDQLRALNTTYDYNAEQARNQLSSLGNQYQQGVNEANTNFQNLSSQIGKTKEQNLSDIERQIQAAGSTAKSTQMKNRNVLRGLGILNSSYAGEALQRPMEQFATQRNDLMTAANQRSQELDDMLTQKTSEHQNMLAGLRNNYDNLVNQIQTDLRFSDRQRADAIAAVNSALSQNIANIQAMQQGIAQQVNTQKQQLLAALQNVNNYATPQANLSNISNTFLNAGQTQPQTQTAGIYDPRKLSQLMGF